MLALRAELVAVKEQLEQEQQSSKDLQRQLTASKIEEMHKTAALTRENEARAKELKEMEARMKELKELKEHSDKEVKRVALQGEEEASMLRAALKNLSDRLENYSSGECACVHIVAVTTKQDLSTIFLIFHELSIRFPPS